MFKHKSFVVKMIDDPKTESPVSNDAPTNSPESIAIEVATEVAIVATAGFVICKVVSTICDIVTHTAETKIK